MCISFFCGKDEMIFFLQNFNYVFFFKIKFYHFWPVIESILSKGKFREVRLKIQFTHCKLNKYTLYFQIINLSSSTNYKVLMYCEFWGTEKKNYGINIIQHHFIFFQIIFLKIKDIFYYNFY